MTPARTHTTGAITSGTREESVTSGAGSAGSAKRSGAVHTMFCVFVCAALARVCGRLWAVAEAAVLGWLSGWAVAGAVSLLSTLLLFASILLEYRPRSGEYSSSMLEYRRCCVVQ